MRADLKEYFFLQILSDYVLLNDIIGGSLNSRSLDKVGLKFGLWLEDDFRKRRGYSGILNVETFLALMVDFARATGMSYTFVDISEEKVCFFCGRCIFGICGLKAPGLCRVLGAIWGGIAARNFGYAKVAKDKQRLVGSACSQVTIYFVNNAEAQSREGTEYNKDPGSYLLSREEMKVLGEGMLLENPAYREYCNALKALESEHNELTLEYNQLRNEIFSDLKIGVFTLNEKEEITFMNQAACELLGIQQTSGLPDNETLRDIIARTLYRGTRFNQYEARINTGDEERYFSFNTSPLYHGSDKVCGAVCVFQDITEKKLLEKEVSQIEKFSLVAELAAGTAHEIRNPMTTLRGFLQFLGQEFEPGSKGSEYCSLMIEEIDRANGIIKEFLLLTQPTAPRLQEIDIHLLLEDIFLLIESKSLLQNVCLQKDYDSDLSCVLADPSQLKQVFLNLATNAIQAMPEGGTLTISTAAAGDMSVINFTDTGVGIKEQDLKRIFDPFFTTKESGTGLGLAVSYRIIKAHGGTINVKSVPGRGSTFSVYLPACRKPSH